MCPFAVCTVSQLRERGGRLPGGLLPAHVLGQSRELHGCGDGLRVPELLLDRYGLPRRCEVALKSVVGSLRQGQAQLHVHRGPADVLVENGRTRAGIRTRRVASRWRHEGLRQVVVWRHLRVEAQEIRRPAEHRPLGGLHNAAHAHQARHTALHCTRVHRVKQAQVLHRRGLFDNILDRHKASNPIEGGDHTVHGSRAQATREVLHQRAGDVDREGVVEGAVAMRNKNSSFLLPGSGCPVKLVALEVEKIQETKRGALVRPKRH
mmetsp:Transcript_5353/g.15296  ORF Transcript_5353/g.15296 Transcript_5353/m.15296 type:complete len:264 (+) Transcript_5353:789-1580(+)